MISPQKKMVGEEDVLSFWEAQGGLFSGGGFGSFVGKVIF